MPRFDGFPVASFNGVKFPCEEIEVRGGLRDHVHEYPHNPGGAPEKLGRKLYEIELVCPFHDTFAKYPGLYPDGLAALRGDFENETTADLVVPTVGTIKAYAMTWRQRATGRQRSGERVTLSFREDMPADGLDAFVSSAQTVAGFTALGQKFDLASQGDPQPQPSLFDDIQNAINDVLAIKDTADRYGNLLESKLLSLADLCNQFDQLDLAKDPNFAHTINALHDIWAATLNSLQDISGQKRGLQHFIVPTVMTIGDVARAVYQDASRAVDILQINAIDDAFAIKPGTDIRYYSAA